MPVRFHVETITCGYLDLASKVTPLLRGNVFHVTNERGFAGINQSGFLRAGECVPEASAPLVSVSFGRKRGYVCLVDFRTASEHTIETTRREYYDFLDPFTDSVENIFLVLRESKYSELIPNHVGVQTRGEAAVPEVEVWHPGPLPLIAIKRIIRVPIARPDPWTISVDLEAFMKLFPPEPWNP